MFAGEPADIRPGTVGWARAEIAKKLINEKPELALLTNRDQLLALVRDIHFKANAVQFDESEINKMKAEWKRLAELPLQELEARMWKNEGAQTSGSDGNSETE